jgi:DNA-directed RNA polymerase specialized sigma subunit
MTGEEQFQTWKQWKNTGDKRLLGDLLKSTDSTIDAALRTYAGNNPRLRTRAYILAREAIDSYDPSKKTGINTHVMSHLRRLYRVSAERSSVVHVPENVRLDSLAVRNFINEYKDQNGADPSDLLVADKLKMSKKRVAKALSFGNETAETSALSEKGDVMEGNVAVTEKSEEDIWKDYVYHDLDETNRKVFEWTTGYNNKPILKKIDVAKNLSISPAAVSQRINTIQKKLNEFNDLPTGGPSLI